jgi:adenosylmethionine-8-amino-7-oxononanoate aminotransferase
MPYANSIAYSPPLIVSDDEVDELVQATREALDEVAATV